MFSPIRVTPLPVDTGTSPTDSPNRAKAAKPSSASLPKGGSQLENLRALGARGDAAGGKTTPSNPRTPPEAGGRQLTSDSSFTFSKPANPPAASRDDDWSQLDDIFRRQPTAGQASVGGPTRSLMDEPQEPLPEPARSSAHQAPAAARKPARSGAFGLLSAFKRVTNGLGLGRLPSSTPTRAASPRPSAAPHGPIGGTVPFHEQNGRPAERRNAIPKLSIEQARREGKPVPSRRPPPPPPMTGSVGHAARPSTPPAEEDDLMDLDIGSGMMAEPRTPEPASRRDDARAATPSVEEDDLMELDISSGTAFKPQVSKPAAQRDDSGPIATPRRAAKRPLREGVDYHLPDLGKLSPIPEEQHETGALASLGQHYDGLSRDLRSSINGANRALQTLRTTPKKGLAAKRAELEHCAAELSRLIDETGMAEADLATVHSLKDLEGPKAPNGPDSLRTRAVLVDRDIHETIRQRNHARTALRTLQSAIASIPGPARR